MHSSISNLRTRPKAVSSNAKIQQPNGAGVQRYSGQIIPRPQNDGLNTPSQRGGERYRNDIITDNSKVSGNKAMNQKSRGSSTSSQSQKVPQNSGTKHSNSNSGYLSR